MTLTPFQLDALCLGGFFAVLVRQPGGEETARRVVAPLALCAFLVLLSVYALDPGTPQSKLLTLPVRHGMLRLLLVAVFLRALFAPPEAPDHRFFRARSLAFLGKYAYGLYVYHHFLSHYFLSHRTEFWVTGVVGSHTLAVFLQAGFGIAASIAAAWLSYEYFEKPFLRLKKFWPSARDVVAPATG
jgi:peptidoglycan/LPS O-acetylase OafA/YrhL